MAYTVKSGDTLSQLYGPNWQQLSGYTGDPRKLQIGTQLPDLPTSSNPSAVSPNLSSPAAQSYVQSQLPTQTNPSVNTQPTVDPYETAKADYTKAYQDYIQTLNPSADVTNATNAYNKYTSDENTALQNISDQTVPMRFITGQQKSLEARAQNQADLLQKNIGVAQQAQAARQNAGLANVSLKEKLLGLEQSPAERAKAQQDLLSNQADIAYKQAQTQNIADKFAEDKREFGLQYALDQQKLAASSNIGGSLSTTGIPIALAPYINTSSSGVKYMDASSLQGTAAQKTRLINQASQLGLKVITNKNESADLTNIEDANSKLDYISTIMKGIDQPNFIARDLYGLGLTKLATLAESNPQQAAAGALQSVGLDILKAISGIQGFRGNQSAIQQVTSHLPTIYDTQATIDKKIEYIKGLISSRENAIVGGTSTQTSQTTGQTSSGLKYTILP